MKGKFNTLVSIIQAQKTNLQQWKNDFHKFYLNAQRWRHTLVTMVGNCGPFCKIPQTFLGKYVQHLVDRCQRSPECTRYRDNPTNRETRQRRRAKKGARCRRRPLYLLCGVFIYPALVVKEPRPFPTRSAAFPPRQDSVCIIMFYFPTVATP